MDDPKEQILKELGKATDGMTAYQLAKEIGLSWPTIDRQLWMLKSEDKVDYKISTIGEYNSPSGRYWFLKKK